MLATAFNELTSVPAVPNSGHGFLRIWWSERNRFHFSGSDIQHIRWRLVHSNQVQGEADEGKTFEGAG